jgi:hypothetical protein
MKDLLEEYRLAESRRGQGVGTHWSPYPTQKENRSIEAFAKDLEDVAKLADWDDATTKAVRAIAKAMRRGSKTQVKRLMAKANVDETSVYNDIAHFVTYNMG